LLNPHNPSRTKGNIRVLVLSLLSIFASAAAPNEQRTGVGNISVVFYIRIKYILSDVFFSSIFFVYFLLISKKEMLDSVDCSVQGKKLEKYMPVTIFILQ